MGRAKSKRAYRLGALHHRYRSRWVLNKLRGVAHDLLLPPMHGILSALSNRYNIPVATLWRWRKKLRVDPDWRPFGTEWGQIDEISAMPQRQLMTSTITDSSSLRTSEPEVAMTPSPMGTPTTAWELSESQDEWEHDL